MSTKNNFNTCLPAVDRLRKQKLHYQTWGQVHEYLYLSTSLKVLVLYLNTFLITATYLYTYTQVFCQVLEYLKYL